MTASSYFPQFDSSTVKLTLDQVLAALQAQELVTSEMHLSDVVRSCYCEDGEYCSCFPEEFVFQKYTIKPNHCETCGAEGVEPCRASGGKRVKFHKKRRML